MEIFNEEKTAQSRCIVLGTFDEWAIVHKAIDDYIKAHPREKKIKKIRDDLELLAVY